VYGYEDCHLRVNNPAPQPGHAVVLQRNIAPHLTNDVLGDAYPTKCQTLATKNLPSGVHTKAWTNQMQDCAQLFLVHISR
jgi:hypothetical protein